MLEAGAPSQHIVHHYRTGMKNRTVLLIEDNPGDQALTMRALRQLGEPFQIVIAHDGAEALDYLFGTGAHATRDPQQLPAVVLMDLKLPKLSGLQVLERLRADTRTSFLPVVILTSSGEERDIRDGYRLGANSYLRKPVDFKRFVSVVQQLGAYWLELNEPPSLTSDA
jgi:two-component system, response regulator